MRGEVGDRGGKCVGGRKDGVGVGMREGRNPGRPRVCGLNCGRVVACISRGRPDPVGRIRSPVLDLSCPSAISSVTSSQGNRSC